MKLTIVDSIFKDENGNPKFSKSYINPAFIPRVGDKIMDWFYEPYPTVKFVAFNFEKHEVLVMI